ncbi:MAG: hypothetical protein ACTSX8_04565 [Alphaproteobacteria bacterium]
MAAGKGSRARERVVGPEQWSSNWDRVFGKATAEEPYPDFIRADHRCICDACGKLYIDHPMDERYLGFKDHYGVHQPYLHLLCDGTLVKL